MLKGSSGQLASVSVAGLNTLTDVNLQESPAGTYRAEYTTQAGDNIDKATVTFLLADQSDDSLQLTIDTTSPSAPTQLQLVGNKIGVENLKQVQISAQTLPLAEIIFTLTDQRDHSQFTQAQAAVSGEATASLDASILLDGPIQVTAQLAPDLAGNSGLPAQIEVPKETPTATFLLEIAEAKTRARVGEDARYTVLLYSQNGFLQPVKLSVDQSTLPAGVTASFQPSEIIFTQPTQKATLTLASGDQAVTGIHQLSVTAQGGEVLQTASLQLELEKLTAFITLNLSTPSPIQYRKPIRLFGQVILPNEASSDDKAEDLQADLPIQLILTRPDQNQQVLETSTQISRTYVFDQVSFDQIGPWTVKVKWVGDSKYNQVEESQQVKVVPAQPILQWMTSPKSVNPQVAPLGQTINLALQLVEPQVKDLSLLLTISRPDQNANQKIRLQTDALGVISTPIQLEADGDWGFIVDWEGSSNYQPVSSTEHRLTVTRELGKAIVVLGGGDESNNPSWTRFNTTASHVYQTLLKRRLTEEDIFYLSPASDPDTAVDEQVSEFQLERAITQWAKNQVSSAVPLWIYLLSHNTGTHFLLHESATGQTWLSAEKLAGWLDQLPAQVPVTLVIEACYSGNFIPILAKPGRVIMTSADAENQAQIYRVSSFSRFLFENIRRNLTISQSFEDATLRMEKSVIHNSQWPQLEADGDGNPNQPSDYVLVKDRYLPDDIEPLTKPVMTDLVATPNRLEQGLTAALLTVRIPGDAAMSQVSALIVPPSFRATGKFDDWQELKVLQLTDPDGDRIFAGSHAGFTASGTYQLIVEAEDVNDNISDSLQIELLVVGRKVPLTGDVNGDNTVNIFDLVIAAGQFGQNGLGLMGDVNDDQSVNIFDLVIVAGNFGQTLAAPSMVVKIELTTRRQLTTLQKHHIASAIDQLESSSNRSNEEETALKVLKSILPERLPTQTRLLANYPNPFNPETWIPFQLAQDTTVTARIYDLTGKQIRVIELGHLSAGNYVESNRAIYWDGKTETGEFVSSGTYFYQIDAGDYRATRKMVILK
jgi:hypothetical protein